MIKMIYTDEIKDRCPPRLSPAERDDGRRPLGRFTKSSRLLWAISIADSVPVFDATMPHRLPRSPPHVLDPLLP